MTKQQKHEESGCTDYLQHSADSCPVLNKDSNLTPVQRTWKNRRNRWAAWNASRGRFGRPENNYGDPLHMSVADERRMLKSEGEGD